MKKNLLLGSTCLTTACVVVFASGAMAADLPSRTPLPMMAAAVPYSWTGLYVGVTAGIGISQYNNTAHAVGNCDFTDSNVCLGDPGQVVQPYGFLDGDDVDSETDFQSAPWAGGLGNTAVFSAGGTIGYNWQFSDHGVFGLEADGAWFSKAGSKSDTFSSANLWNSGDYSGTQSSTSTLTSSTGLNSLFTIRPRLGYAIDRTLLFVTGGLAIGQVHSSTSASFSETAQGSCDIACDVGYAGNTTWAGSSNKTLIGWTVGGGFEQALTDHISMKFDALYYNLGKISTTGNPTSSTYACNGYCGGPPFTPDEVQSYKHTQTVDGFIARAGINYKF